MAKKDVADMSVEQKLKNLYQLQTMLSEIDRIKILRGELPLEVQDLEDEIVAETKAEEEKLREKAKVLEQSIEPRLLAAFKRIRKNSRNGLGIVYVQRDACGGCFNKIPPQRQLDIRMRKKIIVCEYCGRIMIDPELAGVKIEKPVEEKPKRRLRKAATTKEA